MTSMSKIPMWGVYTVSFFLRLAIGFYMLVFQPPVDFCSDENVQNHFWNGVGRFFGLSDI
jgi:hypothetical protein